ncbi:DUF7344 domain-containing protein [Halomicrococcus gelatinilyticus]|uniref:DUF7344 domain-containing protein n=1 Tax=Halomicrococcus gelatinilyticus TaxID=1702103 RepID=UPI002E12A201
MTVDLRTDDTGTASTGTASDDLTQEEVFETLRNRRRRYVVHYLLHEEDESDLRDIARVVAAWENDKRPGEVTSEERRRVYNALQQTHLHKMDDAGVVRFDAARGTVSASERLDDLQVYLEIVPGNEISWSQYYLLLGLFSLSLVLAQLVAVPPFGRVPGVIVAGVIALLFTCSGLAHEYYSREMRLGGDERPPEV